MTMIDMNQSDGERRGPKSSFDIPAIDPLIRPLIPYFAELTTERIAALRSAQASGSYDQIKRLAHTIKGSAASYGFPVVADVAARIEQTIQKPEREEQTPPLIDALAALHTELLQIIDSDPELFRDDEEDL